MSTPLKGRLFQWDSQKGFGFIQPEVGSENIFIHISDFKDKSYRPIIGEIIIYKIGKGKDNKKKAIYAYPERRKLNHVENINRSTQKNNTKRSSFSRRIILFISLGIFILFAGLLQRLKSENNNTPHTEYMEQKIYKDTTDTENIEEFLKKQDKFIAEHTVKRMKHSSVKDRNLCDGREYCSQMKSCDEAKYFLNHCPNTKMDGDGDGIPCEKQWCGH